MAKSESAAVALVSLRPVVVLPLQFQSSHAPTASSSSTRTAKPGTKYFSNCSRAFCAGKLPPSLVSNSEVPRLRASSSSSSFSSRLFFFEPHLEPADERHQHAEAEENRRRLSSQRAGKNRDAKAREKNQHRDREVYQPVFLDVAFHAS